MASLMKFLLLAVFVVTWVQVSVSNKINPSDCGQTDSRKDILMSCTFPWIVAVANRQTGRFCTGSLLTKQHVLLPRTCLFPGSADYLPQVKTIQDKLFVYYVTYEHEKEYFDTFKPASRYQEYKSAYEEDNIDAVIVKMDSEIGPLACARPICIPEWGEWAENADKCMAIGFEVHKELFNLKINRKYAGHQAVMQFHKCAYEYIHLQGVFGKFCTDGKESDLCLNETGRALVCKYPNDKYYLHGMGLAGIDYQCGFKGNSYSRITSLRTWIKIVVATL